MKSKFHICSNNYYKFLQSKFFRRLDSQSINPVWLKKKKKFIHSKFEPPNEEERKRTNLDPSPNLINNFISQWRRQHLKVLVSSGVIYKKKETYFAARHTFVITIGSRDKTIANWRWFNGLLGLRHWFIAIFAHWLITATDLCHQAHSISKTNQT